MRPPLFPPRRPTQAHNIYTSVYTCQPIGSSISSCRAGMPTAAAIFYDPERAIAEFTAEFEAIAGIEIKCRCSRLTCLARRGLQH